MKVLLFCISLFVFVACKLLDNTFPSVSARYLGILKENETACYEYNSIQLTIQKMPSINERYVISIKNAGLDTILIENTPFSNLKCKSGSLYYLTYAYDYLQHFTASMLLIAPQQSFSDTILIPACISKVEISAIIYEKKKIVAILNEKKISYAITKGESGSLYLEFPDMRNVSSDGLILEAILKGRTSSKDKVRFSNHFFKSAEQP
jgi:hypothetical protein